MPAQVPIEARKVSNGVGAEATGGWSVCTVKGPKCASTHAPPGKSMIMSIIFSLHPFVVFLTIFWMPITGKGYIPTSTDSGFFSPRQKKAQYKNTDRVYRMSVPNMGGAKP